MVRGVVRIINRYDAGKFPKHEGVVNLASNENPYPPPKEVLDAIVESFKFVNRYPDPYYPELKQAISDYLNVDENEIMLGNGASDLICCVTNVLLESFDKVTIPIPSYTMYVIYTMLREASINFVEYPYYEINTDDLIEKAKGSKLLFLCSPNNPTGNVIEDLRAILESANCYVFLDEAYAEFYGKSAVKLTDEFENLIVVKSFSKFFSLAGLRVGYGICKNRDLVEAVEKIRLPFCINHLAVKAVVKAVECIDYYKRIRDKIVEERERLYRELKRFEWLRVFPSQANFLLVRVENEIGLAKRLEERNILVRDVTGLMGLKGEHVRVTVGKPEENDALISALKEIEEVIV